MAEENGVNDLLLEYIMRKNVPKEDIIFALRGLQSFPAYRLIAMLKREAVDPFDEEAIRAYWLGDSNPASKEIEVFNHNFATLEKIKIVKGDVKRLVGCSISCGIVLEIKPDKVKVLERGLMYIGNQLLFSTRKRWIGASFLDKIQKGAFLSVHINMAREVISEEQARVLEHRTIQAKRMLGL